MDARRDIVLRVLGWGAVVFFLITGFALEHHALFELSVPPSAHQLQEAQSAYAAALTNEATRLRPTDPIEAARLTAEAARINAETEAAARDRSDARGRAVALIAGALVYAILYPLLIWAVYQKTDLDGPRAPNDLIPRRAAMAFGITMSIVTTVAAFSTAYQ